MKSKDQFDTAINIIGSIPDYHLIFNTIEQHFINPEKLSEIIINQNIFNIRTEESRRRFLRVVNSSILSFSSPQHEEIMKRIFTLDLSTEVKLLVLFWQFSINNNLFYKISKDVFIKHYFSGRSSISKNDITAYLIELLSFEDNSKNRWSDKTINIVASKYLTILKKLNIVTGRVQVHFSHVHLSDESLLIFLFLLKAHKPTQSNILNSDLLSFSMMQKDNLIARIKKLSQRGFLKMKYTGDSLNIDMTCGIEGLKNVVSK